MNKEKIKLSKLSKIATIIGISISSFGLLLYITPYLFKDSINSGIKEVAKSYVKTDVQFKDIDISFFKHFPHLTVTLENTFIKGSAPYPQENLIEAKEIGLGIDLTSIFGEKISFNRLYINEANINLKIDSLGKNNFDIMIPTEEAEKKNESNLALELQNFNIKNSNFLYNDNRSKVHLNLNQMNYNGIIDFTKNVLSLNAKTEIKNVLFRLDQDSWIKNLPLEGNINTKINIDQLGFYFIDNPLKLASFPFNLKGSLEMPEPKQVYNLTISSKNNDLRNIPAIIPEAFQQWAKNVEMKGTSDLLFTMKGIMNPETGENPNIYIETNIKNGFLNYQNSNSPIKSLNLRSKINLPSLNPDSLAVNVDNLDFKLLDGFTKTNFIYKAGKTMYSEGKINSNINLKALKNATGYQKIDAKGQLYLEGNWKGNIQQINNEIATIPFFNLKAKLDKGYFKMKEMPAALDHINLDMNIDNNNGKYKNTSIMIHHIDAKALDNYAKGKIEIQNLETFPIDADFTAKVHLQDIYKIYPVQGIDMRGDLFLQTKAKGTYEPQRKRVPTSNSILTLKNGFIKMHEYPELPLENIQVETHIKSGRGSFSDLNINILPISFTLAGKPFTLRANLSNLNNLDYRIHSKGDLNIGNLYKMFAIDGLSVNGMISTNVGLRGENGNAFNNIQNRGFIKLQDIVINTKYFPSRFAIREGLFNLKGNQLNFENVRSRYKKNAFIINGQLSNYINYVVKDQPLAGNIDFSSPRVNIDDFMAFNNETSASKSTSEEGVILLPKNVELSINGKAKEILFKDIKLQNFDGKLGLKNGQLDLKETKFDMIGSTFNMNGTYLPINNRKAKFSLNTKAKNFDIQRAYKEITLFREMVSAAEKAHGKVSLDYQLEGDLGADFFPKMKTIKGGGTLTLEDIQFHGFKMFNSVAEKTSTEALHDAKLNKVNIKTTIENNVMTIERTKFKIAGFRPRIEGQVTLDGYMNIGMRLGLPPFGIFGIPIKITGPSETFEIEVGQYQKEDLDEADEEFAEYQKSVELENQAKEVKQPTTK